METVELLIFSSLFFLFFSLLFFPAGHLLARAINPCAGDQPQLLAAPGLSMLLFAALCSGGLFCGLPNAGIGSLCVGFCLLALWRWLAAGLWRTVVSSGALSALGVCLPLFLFALLAAAFPWGDLRDVSPQNVRELTGLPLDNLISYNFSRYLVEHIPFGAQEVIPTWQPTDRGPLAGLLNAMLFFMLGLEERGHWLVPTPGKFFFYQALMTYLNVMAVFAVWMSTAWLFGRRAACWAGLLLVSSFFLLLNLVFTWPKLFMGYYMLSAVALWLDGPASRRNALMLGLLLGGALLAHEIASFYIASFLVFFLLRLLRQRLGALSAFGTSAALGAGFAAAVFPWGAVKALSTQAPSRLIHLQLFCTTEQQLSTEPFPVILKRYLSQTPVEAIIGPRISNLVYPFNPLEPWPAVAPHLGSPYAAATALAPFNFYQLIYALGPAVVLLLLGMVFGSSAASRRARLLSGVCYCAIIPAAVIIGCPQSTWSHVWCYPAYLVSFVAAGAQAAGGRLGSRVLALLGLCWGALFIVLGVWFSPRTHLFLHAPPHYLGAQAVLFFAGVLAAALLPLVMAQDEGRICASAVVKSCPQT